MKSQNPNNKTKLSNKKLSDMVKGASGVKDTRIIAPEQVETAAWVRLKCQFGCGGYGQSLVCPPYTPTPQQMRKVLDCYNRGILIHFKPDSEVKSIIPELEEEIFLLGLWKAFGLGAGPCIFCKSCNLEEESCRYPEKARPAMEACGIDVFSTVKKFDFPIEVVTSSRQCPNYYGLILVD